MVLRGAMASPDAHGAPGQTSPPASQLPMLGGGRGGGVEGGISLSLSTPSLRWPSSLGSSELGEHSSFLLSHPQFSPRPLTPSCYIQRSHCLDTPLG